MNLLGCWDEDDEAMVSEMLTRLGVEMTADKFLAYIREATVEELRAWHLDARRARWTFRLILEAIEAVPIEARDGDDES